MPAYIDWPVTNMWWPQTRKPRTAIAEARERDELVAEDRLPREAGDDLADHAHARQDHDVDGRVRVEPEQVLEQDRVAAQGRVEDADVQHPLDGHQRSSVMASTGVPSTMDQAGRVHAPRRTAAAGTRSSPGARILWIVTMKFSPVRIDEKPAMNTADRRRHDHRVREHRAERRVEGPAGVDPAEDQDEHGDRAADHVDVPAQQVERGRPGRGPRSSAGSGSCRAPPGSTGSGRRRSSPRRAW